MSKQDELLDEIVEFAEDGNWEEFDNAVGELRELLSRPTPQADEVKRLEDTEESLTDYLQYANKLGVGSIKAIRLKAYLEFHGAALSHKEEAE